MMDSALSLAFFGFFTAKVPFGPLSNGWVAVVVVVVDALGRGPDGRVGIRFDEAEGDGGDT